MNYNDKILYVFFIWILISKDISFLIVLAKYNEEKEALEDHKQKLKDIIDACKLLYDNFDEKRREVFLSQGP